MADIIQTTPIATQRYSGSAPVNLYAYNDCEELTLGQLANVLCCKLGALMEDQCVVKSNVISRATRRLAAMGEIVQSVANYDTEAVDYDTKLTVDGYSGMTYGDFLVKELGLKSSGDNSTLPADFTSAPNRLALFMAVKPSIESGSSQNQQNLIDLQTYLSRRDVAFSTATSIVKTLGTCLTDTVDNF